MKRVFAIFFVLIFLSACQSDASPAERAVQDFLQAFVEKNETVMVSRVCPAYEMDALLEYDSFALVQATLEGVTCQQIGGDGNSAQVVCQGSIEASYNGELRSFDLSERTYTVLNDGGNWLVCGYEK